MQEQRARERFEVKFEATVHELDETGHVSRSVPGVVSDISQSGMGAFVESMIHEGRQLIVEVNFEPDSKWFLAETVRVSYKPELGHAVGLKLLPLPTTGEIASELARLRRDVAA